MWFCSGSMPEYFPSQTYPRKMFLRPETYCNSDIGVPVMRTQEGKYCFLYVKETAFKPGENRRNLQN